MRIEASSETNAILFQIPKENADIVISVNIDKLMSDSEFELDEALEELNSGIVMKIINGMK